MLSELTIVTINKDKMDEWLDLYRDRIVPLARQLDIKITGAWTDVDRERFIQIRSAADAKDLASSRARVRGNSEWQAIGKRAQEFTAAQDIVHLQPIWHFDDLNDSHGVLDVDRRPLAQLRMYTVNKGSLPDWEELYIHYEVPGHQAAGIALEWLSHDVEEERFFWIRSFQGESDMAASQDRFHSGDDWGAIKDRVPSMLAHIEVIMMNPVEMQSRS